METLLADSNAIVPGVRKMGQRAWFFAIAQGRGLTIQNEIAAAQPAIEARVDHGRWLCDCPNCNGAELVTQDDPIFLCLTCGNSQVEGRFLKVIFPNANTRREIEALLVDRPLMNRNWNIGETIADLAAENAAHGIPERGGYPN
jgi:hypothetical protein